MTDPILLTSAALTAYNHASNIIKSLFELKIDNAVIEKLNILAREIQSLYGSNLELQQKFASSIAEVDNLKKQIASLEEWDNQKRRYKLYSPWDSAVVYAITEANSNGEPPHWLCTKCFEDRKRSFLNARRNKDSGYEEFFCHCGAVVTSHHRGKHKIEYCQ
jgi:hypothetical protein